MIQSIEHTSLLPILFWLLMLPIAIFILMRTTAFWTEEGPGTILGAAKTVFAIWLTVFFVYDLSGYGFARLMQDPRLGIAFPPNYTYFTWLREPMGLKWFVLGYVPLIRYLPVLFALCAGGVVQVLLWKIPFRVGMLVFLSQLFLNIFAMAVLSLVFSFFVGVDKGVDGKVPRRVAAANRRAAAAAAAPEGLPGLQQKIEKLGADEGPVLRRLWGRWKGVNGLLQPAYDLLDPVTSHLPLPAQDCLNGGGWLLLVPGLIALARFRIRGRRSTPTEEELR
ncbi:MAG: hypothetical protein WCJ31_07300 [Planctomycetia bacterium]